jgi:6-phospho-3-hexuloisomerase
MKNIINEITNLSNQFDFSQIDELIELFRNHSENHYVGFGAGRMGYSLRAFIMRLDHLGFKSFMIGDTTFPRVNSSTIAFFNSSSGETESNVLYAKQAQKYGAKLVLFSTNDQSTLANYCDLTILYKKVESKQLMKSIYEQFTFLLFDHICELIKVDLGIEKSYIENNHSISE